MSPSKVTQPFQLSIIIVGAMLFLSLILFLSKNTGLVVFISMNVIPALAIVCAVLVLRFWKKLKAYEPANQILLGFGIGFALWAIAEVMWAVYIEMGVDPYPSIADVLWIAGYIPMIYALYVNRRFMHVETETKLRQILFVLMLLGSALTLYFVILPVIQDFTASRLVEGVVNFLYPLLDLILLFKALELVDISRKSRLVLAWRIIALALAVTALTDIVFDYASWYEIYVNDSTNLISRMIDWGYLLSYSLFILGFQGYYLGHIQLPKSARAAPKSTPATMLSNVNYLIYTDAKDNVIDFSRNLFEVNEQVARAPLAQFLSMIAGVQDNSIQRLNQELHRSIEAEQMANNLPMQLCYPDGMRRTGWLCGIATFGPSKEYSGMNLALRTYLPGKMPYEGSSDYDQSILRYIHSKCDVYDYPFKDSWTSYAEQFTRMIYRLLVKNLGEPIGQRMYALLGETILQRGWGIKLSIDEVELPKNSPDRAVHEMLSTLVQQARDYAVLMIGKSNLQAEEEAWEEGLSKTVVRLASDYGLAERKVHEVQSPGPVSV